MHSDVPLLGLAGVRTVRVSSLGRPAAFFPEYSLALFDADIDELDEAAMVDAILAAVVDRAVP